MQSLGVGVGACLLAVHEYGWLKLVSKGSFVVDSLVVHRIEGRRTEQVQVAWLRRSDLCFWLFDCVFCADSKNEECLVEERRRGRFR